MFEDSTISYDNLILDKSNWKSVQFGDVAIYKKKNVDRENTTLTKYIKGEHMNSEDLHIREWGDLKDEYLGPAFHRLFEKGDILYGSRRTYLRKIAIADFDGITSNTTFVINPKEGKIIPDLLPFIMLSEGFAQHSIKNSKGSVNPYVNWKDIASYQFLFPPKDQQAKIAELLWAMDDVVESLNLLMDNSISYRMSYLKNIYTLNDINSDKKEIGDLIKLSSGKTRPANLKSAIDGDYKYPVYGGNGIIGYSNKFLTKRDTIVIGRVGEYCGVIHDVNSKAWISDNALYIKEFYTDLDKIYLSRYLEHINLNKQQNRSSHPLITQTKVYKNTIQIPNNIEIKIHVTEILKIEQYLEKIKYYQIASKQLQKSLINEIFSE